MAEKITIRDLFGANISGASKEEKDRIWSIVSGKQKPTAKDTSTVAWYAARAVLNRGYTDEEDVRKAIDLAYFLGEDADQFKAAIDQVYPKKTGDQGPEPLPDLNEIVPPAGDSVQPPPVAPAATPPKAPPKPRKKRQPKEKPASAEDLIQAILRKLESSLAADDQQTAAPGAAQSASGAASSVPPPVAAAAGSDRPAAPPASSGRTTTDKIQTVADMVGIADPSGIVDAANAIAYGVRAYREPERRTEHITNAAISAISVLPYIGDLAKLKKYGKSARGAGKARGARGAASEAAGGVPVAKGGLGGFLEGLAGRTKQARAASHESGRSVLDEFLRAFQGESEGPQQQPESSDQPAGTPSPSAGSPIPPGSTGGTPGGDGTSAPPPGTPGGFRKEPLIRGNQGQQQKPSFGQRIAGATAGRVLGAILGGMAGGPPGAAVGGLLGGFSGGGGGGNSAIPSLGELAKAATGAAGVIVGLGASAVAFTKAIQLSSAALIAHQRSLEQFNAQYAFAAAQLDIGRTNRDIQRGQLTGGSFEGLADSLNNLEGAMLRYESLGQNATNRVFQLFAYLNGKAIEIVEKLTPLDEIVDWLNRLLGESRESAAPPYVQLLDDIASGKVGGPKSKRKL